MQVFLRKFVSKPKIWTSLPPYWTLLSSQASFSWRHSVRYILSKWRPKELLTAIPGCGCSWAILFRAKHARNSEIIAYIKTAWLPRLFQNGGLRSHFFRDEFLQDSGHFRGWNFSDWKGWMFTWYRRQQKSRIFKVTFSFMEVLYIEQLRPRLSVQTDLIWFKVFV